MINIIFLVVIGLLLLALYSWSFRTLQKERWQILGTIPLRKNEDGTWNGLNFTYYGFFTALAAFFAVGMIIIMLGSLTLDIESIVLLAACLLVPCFAASKIVARIVEKKAATLSIGGASFIGILISPWLVLIMQRTVDPRIQVLPVLAAIAIAYAFGEAIGRIACISFGCCYGKPVSHLPPALQPLLQRIRFFFIFTGKNKKIAYAHGLDGAAVIPVQGITAVLLTFCGLIGLALFLENNHKLAFLLTLGFTQVWRFISEFLRADYRGNGKISTYQFMGLISVGYAAIITIVLPTALPDSVSLVSGLKILWQPSSILFIELIWGLTFLFTGRSEVTAAHMHFEVKMDKI